MTNHPEVDYLVIGHASLDLTPSGPVPGGTVTYSGRVAQALGCRVGVLTSTASDFDFNNALPGIVTHNIIADRTTTFQNRIVSGERKQTIHALAGSIESEHVPLAWRRAPIVHLGPIADEIDPTMINLFTNSLVGITPQGWLRRWNEHGQVYQKEWPDAHSVISRASAVVVSLEDVTDPTVIEEFSRSSQILVVTEQAGGCTVYCREESRHFSAPVVSEVNPIGAGDSFSAAYFVRLYQTRGNPWESAEFASRVASISVTRETIDQKIAAIKDVMHSGNQPYIRSRSDY